jgi:DNA-binding transcriptional regulator LsrR (DeoR family)
VGDIAYWPVTASGKPEQLVGQNNEQLVFYSAIRLEVLKEMVADGNKKVIVITRGQEKVDPVHAAIFQDKVADSGPYCNVLITDHATAAYLDMHRRV